MNATLLLHRGAKAATLEELAVVPLPPETLSYKPLPHYDLALDTLRIGEEMLSARGFQVDKAQFGLDRAGARLCGDAQAHRRHHRGTEGQAGADLSPGTPDLGLAGGGSAADAGAGADR